jgi:hypothetical protein
VDVASRRGLAGTSRARSSSAPSTACSRVKEYSFSQREALETVADAAGPASTRQRPRPQNPALSARDRNAASRAGRRAKFAYSIVARATSRTRHLSAARGGDSRDGKVSFASHAATHTATKHHHRENDPGAPRH